MYQFLIFKLRRFPRIHFLAKKLKWWCRDHYVAGLARIRRLPAPWSLGLPNGGYSDYQLLLARPPLHEGRVILTDQGNPPAPRDSMMIRANLLQHTRQPWPIFWIRHSNVELVGPSLAHLNQDGLISLEATYSRSDDQLRQSPAFNYPRLCRSRALRLEGDWTSVMSRWMPTDQPQPYGHWLKDALPRLAVLSEFPPDTKILIPSSKLPFQVSSLKLLGVLDRCRWTSEKHLFVENYYFSSPPSMIGAYSPYAVDYLRRTFLPRVQPPDSSMPKRFYLRRGGNIRNVVNEPEILDFFQSIGWAIVDAAAMSFEDQIRLFSQAEAVCGPHGSGFSNLIWSNSKCKVLEVFGSARLCAVAEWICQCLPQLQHRYLIYPADHRMNARIDLPDLKNAMADYDLL